MANPGSTATANRARMPATAAEVDAWRAVFGPVKLRYAVEHGLEVGKRGPVGVPVAYIPPSAPTTIAPKVRGSSRHVPLRVRSEREIPLVIEKAGRA